MNHKQHKLRDLGAQISSARSLRGISQVALAAEIGKDPITVSRYERGAMEPGSLTLGAIAVALDVSPAVLLGWERMGEQQQNRKPS